MQYLLGAIVFVIVLMIIVIIHEMGHFLMAKRAKILCYEFACGMGPLLWKTKKGETVYSIRAIPMGGFVSMAGEEVDQDFLKGYEFVKLVLDEAGRVKKIVCDISLEEYRDLPTYRLMGYDILGTLDANEDELYVCVKEVKLEDALNKIKLDQEKAKNRKKKKSNNETVEVVEEKTEIVEENNQQEVLTFIVNRDALMQFTKKEEYQIAPKNRNMNSKSVGARFLTVFAGPFMNFVLALVIYFIIGIIGGYPLTNSTKVSEISEGAPVYEFLSEGDQITEINGIKVSVWSDISQVMSDIASGNQVFDGKVKVKYLNAFGEEQECEVVPAISIYAIELTINREELANGRVVVGEYAQNNSKTKSYNAGLRKGDVLISVKAKNSENVTPINSINDLLVFFNGYDESFTVEIEYERNGERKTTTINTYSKDLLDSQKITPTKVQLGVSPMYGFDFVQLLYQPFVQTGDACLGIFKTLKLLFTDKSVNISDLSGPVGIFQLVTSTVSSGFLSILSLTAFLSVNIGFVNLLPLPALDGGRLAFLIYEAITKKKPSPKVENTIHNIGFLLLIALFIFVTFNDVFRLIGCK